jgi:hypothetical protein
VVHMKSVENGENAYGATGHLVRAFSTLEEDPFDAMCCLTTLPC